MAVLLRDQALCLFLFNLKHTTECDQYFDSQLSIDVENAAFERVSKLLGNADNNFDLDDEAYLLKATDAERYVYMIKKITSHFRTGKYLVVWENPFFGHLNTFDSDIDGVLKTLDIRWLDDSNMTIEAGWEPHEAELIQNLKINEGLFCFGDHCHTIFRIK